MQGKVLTPKDKHDHNVRQSQRLHAVPQPRLRSSCQRKNNVPKAISCLAIRGAHSPLVF